MRADLCPGAVIHDAGDAARRSADDRGRVRYLAAVRSVAIVGRVTAQHARRSNGAPTLTTLVGDPATAQRIWAQFAAGVGALPLFTSEPTLELATADLLAQMPWPRAVLRARQLLATAAARPEGQLDAALDARGAAERARWLDELPGDRAALQLAGWILTAARQAAPPPLTLAPGSPAQRLKTLWELAAPVAILWTQPAAPTAAHVQRWTDDAARAAAGLALELPHVAIGISAPSSALAAVRTAHPGSALASLLAQGWLELAADDAPAPTLAAGVARSRAERALHDALAADPRTRGHFALNVRIETEGGTAEIDLYAEGPRLAVEVDGWHHFRSPDDYRRDRAKDVSLQRAGCFVMRFLAEDIDQRRELTVEQIAAALERRLAGATAPAPTSEAPAPAPSSKGPAR